MTLPFASVCCCYCCCQMPYWRCGNCRRFHCYHEICAEIRNPLDIYYFCFSFSGFWCYKSWLRWWSCAQVPLSELVSNSQLEHTHTHFQLVKEKNVLFCSVQFAMIKLMLIVVLVLAHPYSIGRPKHVRVMAGALEGDLFVGPKAEEHRGLLSIRYPMEHGIVTDWNDMERIWTYIYSKDQLSTFSEEHPVLLTEAPLNPRKNREKAAEIFFETFNVPAWFVSMQAVLSLYVILFHFIHFFFTFFLFLFNYGLTMYSFPKICHRSCNRCRFRLWRWCNSCSSNI